MNGFGPILADVLEQRLSLFQAVVAVALLGMLGVFLLLVLGYARRRYLFHQRQVKPTTPLPDIWRESGRRLTEKLGHQQSSDADPDAGELEDDDPPLRRPNFLDDLDKLPPESHQPPPNDDDDDDQSDEKPPAKN